MRKINISEQGEIEIFKEEKSTKNIKNTAATAAVFFIRKARPS